MTEDHSHSDKHGSDSSRGSHRSSTKLATFAARHVTLHGPDFATDALGLPYTTLSYANGPGYQGASDKQPEGPKRFPHIVANAQPAKGRAQLKAVDTEDPDYLQEATLPANSETHGGDDVGVWASGPGAAAVHGSIEQNEIFHLLLQAQPELRRLLCSLGDCEQGVPVVSPSLEVLREGGKAQAR